MDKYRDIHIYDIKMLRNMPGLIEYDGQMFICNDMDEAFPKMILRLVPLPAKMRFTAIFLCLAGNATVKVSGRTYSVEENVMLMLSVGNIVEEVVYSDDFRAVSVAIMPDSELLKFTYSSTRFLRNALYEPGTLTLTPEESKRMVSFFQTVKGILTLDSEMFRKEALEGASIMLASYLSSKLATKANKSIPPMGKWRSNDILRRFLTEVSQHYTVERSVQYYASRLFISPKYFAQVIFHESGKHAKDWIREFVIKDAKTMLQNGNYTVQEVSEALHFPNQSFFGKYFKEAVGCSPRQFKALCESSPSRLATPQDTPHLTV